MKGNGVFITNDRLSPTMQILRREPPVVPWPAGSDEPHPTHRRHPFP